MWRRPGSGFRRKLRSWVAGSASSRLDGDTSARRTLAPASRMDDGCPPHAIRTRRALRARYFPRPVRNRASASATASSSTRSSAPKPFSRSLSTLSTPSSREANFIEMSILDRVSGSATSAGNRRPRPTPAAARLPRPPGRFRPRHSAVRGKADRSHPPAENDARTAGWPRASIRRQPELAGGTINFQGRVLRVRKIEASVTAGGRGSTVLGATWQLALAILRGHCQDC